MDGKIDITGIPQLLKCFFLLNEMSTGPLILIKFTIRLQWVAISRSIRD